MGTYNLTASYFNYLLFIGVKVNLLERIARNLGT